MDISPRQSSLPTSRYVLFGVLAALGLTVDLATKAWFFWQLGFPHRTSQWNWSCPLLWGRFSIRFTTSFNQGALFGMGQGFGWLFALMSLLAIGFILYWLFIRQEARSVLLTAALGVITAGILGNLYDRLYWHGCRLPDGTALFGVRDFIDCTIPWLSWKGPLQPELIQEWPWPIFNIADSFLVCGAITLILHSLLVHQPAPATAGSELATVPTEGISFLSPAPAPARSNGPAMPPGARE